MRKFTLALLLASGLTVPALAQEAEERENVRMERNDTHQSDGGDTRGRGWGNVERRIEARSAPVREVQAGSAEPDNGNRRNSGWGGLYGRRGGAVAQPAPPVAALPADTGGWRGNRPAPVMQTPPPQPDRSAGGFERRDGDRGRRGDWSGRTWGDGAAPNPSNGSGRNGGWQPGRRDSERADAQGDGGRRNWGDGRNGGDGRSWGDGRNWRNNGDDRRRDNDRYRDGYRDRDRWAGRDDRPGNWNNGGYDRGRHWNGRNDRWDRGWRNSNRYNWYSYRSYNRNLYRAPRYYNPYGYRYGYNRFSIGIYLNSLFYSSDYWINDPWSYRLPESTWPYRWVRYYNDVLLVDVRSGYVVDAIYGFFW